MDLVMDEPRSVFRSGIEQVKSIDNGVNYSLFVGHTRVRVSRGPSRQNDPRTSSWLSGMGEIDWTALREPVGFLPGLVSS
jgi:hypothetical protein